ncbi:MAG: hypothetical protein KC731_32710 [Myxococcales bacterium]|nr:hypothetical protein [Myxococcales bacterium]
MDQGTSTSSAGRWLALVLAMGVAGWAAFTLFERSRAVMAAAPTASATPSDPLEPLLVAAQDALLAGRLQEAKGKLEEAERKRGDDPQVLEGLALLGVLEAEQTWWKVELGAPERESLVSRLDMEVDRARAAIATGLGKIPDRGARTRLKLYERQLNTFVVVSFVRAGEQERADGAMHARLGSHPQRALIEAYVKGRGASPESPDGGVLDDEMHPAPSAAPPAARTWAPEPYYELDDEPVSQIPTTPGELQLPQGQE